MRQLLDNFKDGFTCRNVYIIKVWDIEEEEFTIIEAVHLNNNSPIFINNKAPYAYNLQFMQEVISQ